MIGLLGRKAGSQFASHSYWDLLEKDPSDGMTELQSKGMLEDYVQYNFVEKCNEPSGFFNFPSWHEYLFKRPDYIGSNFTGTCTPIVDNINDVWHVALAVLEMLIRASALLALAFIIYSGFSYMLSQGRPDKVEKAKKTLLYAVIGFAFSAAAIFIVTFAAGLVS